MKKPILIAFAAFSLLVLGCEKAEDSASHDRVVSLTASISRDGVKATVTDAGLFTWATGDEIGVWTSDGQFTKFSLKDGEAGKNTAVFTAELEAGVTVEGPAVYPYRAGHSYDPATKHLTYNQPQTMDWVEGVTKSHMAAKYNGSGTIQFKQLDGLFRITVYNVPNTVGFLRLRSSENVLFGDFDVDMNEANPQITASPSGGASDFNLKVNAPADGIGNVYVVNFPVPVGTYTTTRISAQKANWDMIASKTTSTSAITIGRGTMVIMPEVTLNEVMLADNEDGTLRANYNNGYSNTEGTSLTVVDNPSKEIINASNKVVKVDASAQDPSDADQNKGGYFLLKTQNSDYSNGFRDGTKAFKMKIRYNNAADAAIYYPWAFVNGGKVGDVSDVKRLPDKVNGKDFTPQNAETWASLIKPGEWNVLQWTSNCAGTWRMEITPFATISGDNATTGTRIMLIDDMEYIK